MVLHVFGLDSSHAANSSSPFSAGFFSTAGDARERHKELQRHPYVDLSQVPHHHLVVHEFDNQATQHAESQQPLGEHAEEAILERAPVVEEEEGHRRRTPGRRPYAMAQSQHLPWDCLYNMWSEEHIQKVPS